MIDFAALLEAVLFFKTEPISIKKLAEALEAPEPTVAMGLKELADRLKGRGIVLMEKDNDVMLGTIPEAGGIIEKLKREEITKEIGKAGLETLSIVLYKGPISRSRIDHIRGVNSAFILRNLLVRGLVERVSDPGHARGFLYRATFDLLSYLGILKPEELPEYELIDQGIADFEKCSDEEEGNETTENATTREEV